jgi:hypothetical protein
MVEIIIKINGNDVPIIHSAELKSSVDSNDVLMCELAEVKSILKSLASQPMPVKPYPLMAEEPKEPIINKAKMAAYVEAT